MIQPIHNDCQEKSLRPIATGETKTGKAQFIMMHDPEVIAEMIADKAYSMIRREQAFKQQGFG